MSYDVAIVGSGFSAIAETINLLQKLPAGASVAVVGDDPGFGRGTAYRTELNAHRLNVPAGRMSIFPDVPDDFTQWLAQQQRDVPADGFASRGDFGRYLRDRLAALLRSRDNRATLHFIKAKATTCDHCSSGRIIFQLDNGSVLEAKTVVLCLGVGNAPLPVEPIYPRSQGKRRVIANPWRLGWMSHVAPQDPICILGSGLTMVDQVLALRAHGHRGRIDVLSRRGLVSHAHRPHQPPVVPDLPESMEISAILSTFRRIVRQGTDWRSLMDGLRPTTQKLWQKLSAAQRARFLRHALPWWNIHRHRLAPDVASQLHALIDAGTVVLHAGFLQAIEADGDGVTATFRQRGTRDIRQLNSRWLINCTGMERAGIGHSPLLTKMRDHGMIAAADLGLGICVDDNAQVLDGSDRPQAGLYAIGALTAGQFWEITAVPDIRVQAQAVAARIVASRS